MTQSKAHPHAGPVFKNADELRLHLEQREATALREELPDFGKVQNRNSCQSLLSPFVPSYFVSRHR